jgi:hypothetical protein
MSEEIRSYLGMTKRLHVLLRSVNTASRLLEPNYVDGFVGGPVCVFAGKVGIEAFGAKDEEDVDYLSSAFILMQSREFCESLVGV